MSMRRNFASRCVRSSALLSSASVAASTSCMPMAPMMTAQQQFMHSLLTNNSSSILLNGITSSSAHLMQPQQICAQRFCSGAPDKVSVFDTRDQEVALGPNDIADTFQKVYDKCQPWLKQGIEAMGYPKPTHIQSYTLPLLFQGRDMIGLAATGSGKTVAFAIPALSKIEARGDGYPQCIVLCPVRELAQQTALVFKKLCQFNSNICVREAYGGSSRGLQQHDIYAGCDVLVATPGRLKDFLEAGVVDAKHLKFMVFDEADRLLDMGFSRPIADIMRYMPKTRQTMMWSATWPEEVQQLAGSYLNHERYKIKVGHAGEGLIVNANITQKVYVVETDRERLQQLAKLYEKREIDPKTKTILFVQRKDTCELIAQRIGKGLEAAGIMDSRAVVAIHGGMDQPRRDQIVKAFKAGRIMILVATDVAARGLDFPDVGYVVNYDCPKDIESYCHRIGRTGRAGRKGTAHSFILPDAKKLTPDLVDYLHKSQMEVSKELEDTALDAKEWLRRREGKAKRYGGGGGGGYGGGRDGGEYGGYGVEGGAW